MSGERLFTIEFDVDEITQIGCFRFIEKIVSNGYDFLSCTLFDLRS